MLGAIGPLPVFVQEFQTQALPQMNAKTRKNALFPGQIRGQRTYARPGRQAYPHVGSPRSTNPDRSNTRAVNI